MATLKQVRAAIQTTLESAIAGLKVYRTVEAVEVLPAVVVAPSDGGYATMGRGVDRMDLGLMVLVNPGVMGLGQDELDDFLAGAGPKSIRQVLFANRTLGLTNTDAQALGWDGYGGRFESAGIDHIGAVVRITVHTPGTE